MVISTRKLNQLLGVEQRFAILYAGSFVTGEDADDVISAIKKFNSHFNSTITIIIDRKTEEIYYSKENDEPDERGYFNHSFYNQNDEFIYNEDEAVVPIKIIAPVTMTKDSAHGYIDTDGNFYECGFEGHDRLADELFFSKTLIVTDEEKDSDIVKKKDWYQLLEQRGWVKISSMRIRHMKSHHGMRILLTKAQKDMIFKFIELTNKAYYDYNYDKLKVSDLLNEIIE